MKNLLFFTSDYQIGISALLTDQLLSMHNSGINVTAVGGENEQEHGLTELLQQNKIRFAQITGLDAHNDFIRLVKRVTQIVIQDSIDIIHVQNNWQLAIAFAVKCQLFLKRKVAIIYTLHGFRHNSPIKSRIAQVVIGSALLISANHIICMTEYLRKKFKLLSYKISIIPLGVKDNYFLDNYKPPTTEKLKLIFPAQFRHGKNQDLILRAFNHYIKQNGDTNSTLTLPGNGPLIDNMKDLSKSLGIENQVFFPGLLSKDEIKRLYLDSNIAIVASNSETFGQSIVEPFVLGRCVVSTPVGIAPEIIIDGENGYIYSSEYELAAVLSNLQYNRECLVKIGHNNFRNREKFSWHSITTLYINEFLNN